MKRIYRIFLFMVFISLLTGCNKHEESYEGKDIEVESAFDGLDAKIENDKNEEVVYEERFVEEGYIKNSELPLKMVATKDLELVEKPDKESDVIMEVKKGQEVVVIKVGLGDDWSMCKVVLDDEIGYLPVDFLYVYE